MSGYRTRVFELDDLVCDVDFLIDNVSTSKNIIVNHIYSTNAKVHLVDQIKIYF